MILPFPDTPLVVEASKILRAAAPQVIINHSQRTFLLARAYAERRAMRIEDEESLYLAALYHDLGLCPGHRKRFTRFMLQSAQSARASGAPQASAIAEAIEVHMRFFPAWSKGQVAGLLQVGAWMDVVFRKRLSIRREAREIARAYPRLGLDLAFPKMLLASFFFE